MTVNSSKPSFALRAFASFALGFAIQLVLLAILIVANSDFKVAFNPAVTVLLAAVSFPFVSRFMK